MRPGESLKATLVGERPGKGLGKYAGFPLSGAVGKRLAIWTGLKPEEGGTPYGQWYWPLRQTFDLANVFYGERSEGELEWDVVQARRNAEGIVADAEPSPSRAKVGGVPVLNPPMRFVLLGKKVAAAFGHNDPDWFQWMPAVLGAWIEPRPRCIVIPHPSGRNRLYADDAYVAEAMRVLRSCATPLVYGA